MRYTGDYTNGPWSGYRFGSALDYTSGYHTGVDYNYGSGFDDYGEPIKAIADGSVRFSALSGSGFGNTIIIQHLLSTAQQKKYGTTSVYSRYLHLKSRTVTGGSVKRGQVIGYCGNTGTNLPHLHLDIWKAVLGVHQEYHKNDLSQYLDPFKFIEANKVEEIDMPLLTLTDKKRIFYGSRVRLPNEDETASLDKMKLEASAETIEFMRTQWTRGEDARATMKLALEGTEALRSKLDQIKAIAS